MESDVRCGGDLDQHTEVRQSPILRLRRGLVLTVDSLLNDPNTASPANVEASNLYKENKREYVKRVRETVEKSWDC